ncbi:hypothetical protein Tco_0340510 [Tanacetum coccineum]
MTHKLDDMIELLESRPKETNKEDLECEMVMVKVPRCMSFLDSTNAYDEPICSLDRRDKVDNPSSQSTPQVIPSFEEYTPTYPKEVEETLGTPMEVEPSDQMKLEDVDDPKKHYGFKPGLLGQGGSLGVDLLNWEVIFDEKKLCSS